MDSHTAPVNECALQRISAAYKCVYEFKHWTYKSKGHNEEERMQ